MPDEMSPLKVVLERRMGIRPERPDVAKRVSPIYHATEIHAPLLMGHGADDPLVDVKYAVDFVQEIRKLGGDATLVVYPNERHGLGSTESKLDFYGRAEEFLAKHLGGRSEPLQDVPGSGVQLR